MGIPTAIQPPRNPDPHAELLARNAESIRQLERRVIGDIIEIGRLLSDCKQLLGHGNWISWIDREFALSERTARNYISAYDFVRSKSANVADLRISIGSLYLLAARSTPEVARTEAFRRIDAGETLSHSEVKRIVEGAPERSVRAPPRMRTQDVIEALGHGDFARLPGIEQDKILAARPKNVDLAINDATIRQGWKRPYRELQDALDSLDAAKKWSNRKIISAIPPEHLSATVERLESAKNFLIKLHHEAATR
jgi:hypothetical protein